MNFFIRKKNIFLRQVLRKIVRASLRDTNYFAALISLLRLKERKR